MIAIGIDTGTHTGLAVWDTNRQQFCMLGTYTISSAMEWVERWATICAMAEVDMEVVFEDARQRKYLPREKSVSEYRGRMMGAGSIKRDASIWEEWLSSQGIRFRMVPPTKGLTKLTDDYFRRLTGYNGKTSNHARDAAMLVFARH